MNVSVRGKQRVTEKSQHGKLKEIQKLKETKGGKKPIRLLRDVVAFLVLFCYFLWPYYSKDGICRDGRLTGVCQVCVV